METLEDKTKISFQNGVDFLRTFDIIFEELNLTKDPRGFFINLEGQDIGDESRRVKITGTYVVNSREFYINVIGNRNLYKPNKDSN